MIVELATDQPLDLAASLESGQSHRWERDGDWFSGVVQGTFIKMRQTGKRIEFRCDSLPQSSVESLLRSYFRLDDDLPAIYSEIKADPRVAEMVDFYRGLRLLRIEQWGCLTSFICSANSNLLRMHQNM